MNRSATGEYSAERLKELQKNTVQLPASKKPDKPSSESIFKLSGSFKSATALKDDRFETTTHVVNMHPAQRLHYFRNDFHRKGCKVPG